MAFRKLCILGLEAWAASTTGASQPVVFPLEDVQVVPGISQSLMKGIRAEIGTPPQSVVLLPWAHVNNTWLYDGTPTYCDDKVVWNDLICRVRRGGFFVETDSTSYTRAASISAVGAPIEFAVELGDTGEPTNSNLPKLASSGEAGTDSVALAGAASIEGFPVGTPRFAWDVGLSMLHPLGLGRNSTYLNALRRTGAIASRTWAVFWGRMWVDDGAVDGHVVLGGYDRRKTTGPNHTFPLDFSAATGCGTGLSINVADIKLNFKNGEDKSLLPAGHTLNACIEPHNPVLLVGPSWLYENYEKATNLTKIDIAYGLHRPGAIFPESKYFDGDITFELKSGLNIRVANDQYTLPHIDIDRNGSRIYDDSTREVMFDCFHNFSPMLGRIFLTAAYLLVDHDAGTFTLWEASATNETDLVEIKRAGAAAGLAGNGGSTVSSPDGSVSSPGGSVSSPDGPASDGVSAGTIAGVVVGTLAGLAILAAALWWWLRRRKSARRQAAQFFSPDEAGKPELPAPYSLGSHQPPSYGEKWRHEIGSTQIVAEVPDSRHLAHEAPGNFIQGQRYELG